MDTEPGEGLVASDSKEVVAGQEIDEIQRSILSGALNALTSPGAITVQFPSDFRGEYDRSKLSYEGGGQIKFVVLNCPRDGATTRDEIVIASVSNTSPENDISTGFALAHLLARAEGRLDAYSQRDISITRIKKERGRSTTAVRLNLSDTIKKTAGTFSLKMEERPSSLGYRNPLERLWDEGSIQLGEATLFAGTGDPQEIKREDFLEINRAIPGGVVNKKMMKKIVNSVSKRRKARVVSGLSEKTPQLERKMVDAS